jgi:hypothetical protein
VVALCNRTYPPTDELTLRILETLDRSGEIPAREQPVDARLATACADLRRLLLGWDDALADAIFSANVLFDEPADRRRREAARLVDRIGGFEAASIVARGATRARITLRGERDTATLEVMLSPEVPPRIQWYEISLPPT